MRQDVSLAALLAHLELDLPEEGGHDGGDVADARDVIRLTGAGGAAHGGTGRALVPRGPEPGGDARPVVDGRGLTQAAGEARQDLERAPVDVGDEGRLL